MPEYLDKNGKPYWTYVLYVVELDPAACTHRKSKCPRNRCDRVPVYVGKTGKTPGERLAEHKRGIRRGEGWVYRHGLHLRKRLVHPKREFATSTEALNAEHALAVRLDKQGYCVYGGH